MVLQLPGSFGQADKGSSPDDKIALTYNILEDYTLLDLPVYSDTRYQMPVITEAANEAY